MIIAIVISLLTGLFGLFMVNQVGNYETIWGFLMVGGAVMTLILSLVSIGSFLIALL
jgi:hypothetical protein